MSGAVPVHVGLELPLRAGVPRLGPVVESAAARLGASTRGTPEERAYWSAAHFGLDRARAFREASAEVQAVARLDVCRAALEEAYFIERSGMAFTAKMVLLSESVEERMLYCLFAGDEAAHLHEVSAFLGEPPTGTGGPFLDLLGELIEAGDRDSLVLVIQVVLEGWGLVHYRGLAEHCLDERLAAALQAILRDEARHHGSGLVLAQARPLSPLARAWTTEILVRFLAMVQAGPQGLVAALDRAHGGLSRAQRLEAFEDLDATAHAAERLGVLRGLIEKAGAQAVVDELERRGCFRPLTPEECCT